MGIPDVCPPLCTKKEIDDGTYTLADVEEMNQTMEEALNAAMDAKHRAIEDAKRNRR